MIRSLYNFTAKGLLQALSFILATFLFGFILLNSNAFAQHFGGKVPYLALLSFYGMAILWIHGIGFSIRSTIWQAIFLPISGYILVIFFHNLSFHFKIAWQTTLFSLFMKKYFF